jgi:hypothetical protein
MTDRSPDLFQDKDLVMSKTIVGWGTVFLICVWGQIVVRAAPLGWEEAFRQIHFESQPLLAFAPTESRPIVGLRQATGPDEKGGISATGLTLVASQLHGADVPVLALPESGTLILLGLGLASIAALMRKKNRSR